MSAGRAAVTVVGSGKERDAFTDALKALDLEALVPLSRSPLRGMFEAQLLRQPMSEDDDEWSKFRSLYTSNPCRRSDDEYVFRMQSDLPRYRDYRLDVVMRRTSGRWYVEEMRPAAP